MVWIRRLRSVAALAVLVLATGCPPPGGDVLTTRVPAAPPCPEFAAGTPIKKVAFSVGTSRQLRRSMSRVGGTCHVTRDFNWPSTPGAGTVRIASYVDDCGTRDESSALVIFDLTNVASAVGALSHKDCRVISASATFTTAAVRTNLASTAGEVVNCVGSVHRATNADWTTIPSEDYWTNQFLRATSEILDPRAATLPIHIPPRSGESGAPPPLWEVLPSTLSIDLTEALRRWIDGGAANQGIVLFPQGVLNTLEGAEAPTDPSGACLWDLSFGVATATLDASP